MKPISEWTIVELKAAAFDELAKLETCRTNVRVLQDEIRKREQVPGDSAAPSSDGGEPKAS